MTVDIIKDFKNKIEHYGKDYRFTQEEILNILERYEIKYALTIIQADKEQKLSHRKVRKYDLQMDSQRR